MKKKQIPKDPGRAAIQEKIARYEREGRFDEDVEDDPDSPVLLPEGIEYIHKGFWGGCKRVAAFSMAYSFFWYMELKKRLVLRPAQGLESLKAVPGGAIITCNHFLPFDSFFMQLVYDASHHKKRMYRVIREGNYTNFPGFYGILMRHCNTLPLSSNLQTMKKFLRATQELLQKGNCILIYPEQSMWWNYRKPKPLKPGAFDMAVKNRVPVIPCFITMEETGRIGPDGFPVLIYTPHIGVPIYPDDALPRPAAREKLKAQTEQFNKAVYESVYGLPLTYTCDE